MDRNENRTAIIVLLIVLAVVAVLVVPLLVMAPMMGWGMAGSGMMRGYGPGGIMSGWGWLLMLLFWVLLIAGVALIAVWLARQGNRGAGHSAGPGAGGPANGGNSGSPGNGSRGPDALEILKQRYARGEITKEVYEQMKRDLLAD